MHTHRKRNQFYNLSGNENSRAAPFNGRGIVIEYEFPSITRLLTFLNSMDPLRNENAGQSLAAAGSSEANLLHNFSGFETFVSTFLSKPAPQTFVFDWKTKHFRGQTFVSRVGNGDFLPVPLICFLIVCSPG